MRVMIISWVVLFLANILGLATCQRSSDGTYLGSFTNYVHDIAGDVYALDNTRLRIKGFTYDGTGPDAFFWVGSTAKPDGTGIIVPYGGVESPLGQAHGQDITIKLPSGLAVKDLKWISVWCREFAVNFGDLIFPESFDVPGRKTTPIKPAAPAPAPVPGIVGESSVEAVGPLATFRHRVRGDVAIFDDETIVVNKFRYDGRGKGAHFWADYGDQLTSEGQLLGSSLTVNPGDALPRAIGNQMVIVKIPKGRKVRDYRSFGVWSLDDQRSYAEVKLPVSGAPAPPTRVQTQEHVKPKENKLNCEILDNDSAYEVRWALTDDNIVMQLVGKIDDGNYMAFGLSGDEQTNIMVGGDVVVAWIDDKGKGHAEDYYLKSKESCTNNRGACPDVKFGKQNNVELLNSAVVNGFHMVTVKRPLFKQDEEEDENIYIDGPQAVIWASGKINSDNMVSYHFKKRSGETKMIDFARNPKWNCPEPSESSENTEPERKQTVPVQRQTSKPKERLVPWNIPKFTCPRQRKFQARIGPSGGKRGYQAITGEIGWGIAWYLNEILLPELTLERGKRYIFEVEGGNDPNNAAKTHPFYITSSPVGGYASASEEDKKNEIIYAGAEFNRRDGKYEATAAGRLCEYELRGNKRADDYETFDDFRNNLREKCSRGRPAILQWTPTSRTPDTVYYQCFTHKRLGYKINIVDSCDGIKGAESILLVKNISKVQSVDEKIVEQSKVPVSTAYKNKPAPLPQLPRPIVRPRPTESSDNNRDPTPIVVEEVVQDSNAASKPPKRTIYVPVKIVPEDELPENIPIHDGSDKQFVFGNPIAVPLGVRRNKPNTSNNKFSYESGFRPLILRDQSSITHPLKNKFHNKPTHLVGSESIGQNFKAPDPETGFKVIHSVKQTVKEQNKDKTAIKKKPNAQNLNVPIFEPQKIHPQTRPQYEEQPGPQYQEGKPRPPPHVGQIESNYQRKPPFQSNQPRPQYQGDRVRPPHTGQYRPHGYEEQRRPDKDDGRRPDFDETRRPDFYEEEWRPDFYEEERRPDFYEEEQRPDFYEEERRPGFGERPPPHFLDGRPRPHLINHQKRPDHYEGPPHPRPRPPHHIADNRRPPPRHQRRPFKNQPQANYEERYPSPSNPVQRQQSKERPLTLPRNNPGQINSYKPPSEVDAFRRPTYPQPNERPDAVQGSKNENEAATIKRQQGPRNGSEYAVLTHVMEYISHDQQEPTFGHNRSKRETDSADAEPKAEPEPKKNEDDKESKDKKNSQQSSKNKNDATTISLSLFTIAIVALAALFL